MNKNRLKTKLNLKSLFNGEYWFGDEKLNIADKHIDKTSQKEDNSSLVTRHEIESIKHSDVQDFVLDNKAKIISDYPPAGYIRLYLRDIDINHLFLKHNITLKYIKLGDELYIKSFVLGLNDREIDCYHEGENQSLTISKKNDSQINIKLIEIAGSIQEVSIVNGVILN